jgi:hypothetical protein
MTGNLCLINNSVYGYITKIKLRLHNNYGGSYYRIEFVYYKNQKQCFDFTTSDTHFGQNNIIVYNIKWKDIHPLHKKMFLGVE